MFPLPCSVQYLLIFIYFPQHILISDFVYPLYKTFDVTVALQVVKSASAAAAGSLVTVAMPTFYTLPAVQPVPRVTPVSQTAIRPAETITLSQTQSRMMTLPTLMPAKSVASVLASATPVAPPVSIVSPTSTAVTTLSASSTPISMSPTAGNRPVLRVIIPNTRNAVTSDDVSLTLCTLLLQVNCLRLLCPSIAV